MFFNGFWLGIFNFFNFVLFQQFHHIMHVFDPTSVFTLNTLFSVSTCYALKLIMPIEFKLTSSFVTIAMVIQIIHHTQPCVILLCIQIGSINESL